MNISKPSKCFNQISKYCSLSKHKSCLHRKCSHTNCNWKGKETLLEQHLNEKHEGQKQEPVPKITKEEVINAREAKFEETIEHLISGKYFIFIQSNLTK